MGITGQRDKLLEYVGLTPPMAQGLPYGRGVKIRRSVTINRPPEQLYRYWRSFENLPRLMDRLESVTETDRTHSHWVAKGPRGRRVEWDAEIIAERENEMIGWRSVGGSADHAGSVHFERAPGDRGTVVRVQIQYNPPGGRLAAEIAEMFGAGVEQMIRESGDVVVRVVAAEGIEHQERVEAALQVLRQHPGELHPCAIRGRLAGDQSFDAA